MHLCLVCLCRKTRVLSHENILFELANYISYARKAYSYDRNYMHYEKKQVILPHKKFFLASFISHLKFSTDFFCWNISES